MNADLTRWLLGHDPVPARLGEDSEWSCVYGRMAADGATLVYESERGPRDARAVHVAAESRAIRVRRWSDDQALPALQSLRQRHPDALPVRYRPGKRCTLRKGELFLKCVADDRGCDINRDAAMLWQASQRGGLAFGVARPGGWLPSLRMIVQHRLPGSPLADRLWSDAGRALAARLGAANASLTALPLRPETRFTYADQMKRTAKYARRMARHLPEAATVLERILERLRDVEPGAADRPIHGAPHAHQWLDGPDGLMLVDFDRFGLGDPELDVATFMGEADFEDTPHRANVADAYREGFEARWPLNPHLLQAYRLHKHVAKALRTFSAIRSDASQRTLAILRDTLEQAEAMA
jgi:hypothetical protein